ncbi:hypothetical protein M885DRAFT_46406, partial [Pelagophyceae sp. CCMP2097]
RKDWTFARKDWTLPRPRRGPPGLALRAGRRRARRASFGAMELLLSYADSCFSSDKSKRSLDNQLFAKFGLYADERQRIRTADLGAVLDDFFLEPLSKAEIEQYANRLSSHAVRSRPALGPAIPTLGGRLAARSDASCRRGASTRRAPPKRNSALTKSSTSLTAASPPAGSSTAPSARATKAASSNASDKLAFDLAFDLKNRSHSTFAPLDSAEGFLSSYVRHSTGLTTLKRARAVDPRACVQARDGFPRSTSTHKPPPRVIGPGDVIIQHFTRNRLLCYGRSWKTFASESFVVMRPGQRAFDCVAGHAGRVEVAAICAASVPTAAAASGCPLAAARLKRRSASSSRGVPWPFARHAPRL